MENKLGTFLICAFGAVRTRPILLLHFVLVSRLQTFTAHEALSEGN